MNDIFFTINNLKIIVTPITVTDNFNLRKKSLAVDIEETSIDYEKLGKLYYIFSSLFGETTNTYDDFKCSFIYYFKLSVVNGAEINNYLFNLCDKNGTIFYNLRKLINDEDLHLYKFEVAYPPFSDFKEDEINYFTFMFLKSFDILGDVLSFRKVNNFVRTINSYSIIYGYRDNRFFFIENCRPENFDFYLDNAIESGIPVNSVSMNKVFLPEPISLSTTEIQMTNKNLESLNIKNNENIENPLEFLGLISKSIKTSDYDLIKEGEKIHLKVFAKSLIDKGIDKKKLSMFIGLTEEELNNL